MILHYGDLADSSNIMTIVNSVRPDEVYNLAAQSHVKVDSRARPPKRTRTPAAYARALVDGPGFV